MAGGTPMGTRRVKRQASDDDNDDDDQQEEDDSTVLDHLCRPPSKTLRDSLVDSSAPSSASREGDDDAPDVVLGGLANATAGGRWIPDLTLRYPPTFSHNDFIVGIDGGVLVNGLSAADSVDRPKFANVTLIRDQVGGGSGLGAIDPVRGTQTICSRAGRGGFEK